MARTTSSGSATHPEDAELTITLAYSFDDGETWTTFASWLGERRRVRVGCEQGAEERSLPDEGHCIRCYGNSGEAISGEFVVINAGVNSFVAGPVPASDVVNFYVNASGEATLYVYDVAGRLVFSEDNRRRRVLLLMAARGQG
jgi:YD repeat-containing protein